jgi:DNA-binding NtrC family response regulator
MVDRIKLLVVDDEIKFLNSMARRLELRGFDVTKAASGREAVNYANKTRFDLVLLDLKMPGIGGKEVLKELKQRDDLIEVVVLTGHGSLEAAVECMKMGAYGYLPKPFELEEILEILRQAYAARLRKQNQADPVLMSKLKDLGSGPNALEALRAMRELAN